MGKNWTVKDQIMLESDIKDSILAEAAYFKTEPKYNDLEEVEFDEFCNSFFSEF